MKCNERKAEAEWRYLKTDLNIVKMCNLLLSTGFFFFCLTPCDFFFFLKKGSHSFNHSSSALLINY